MAKELHRAVDWHGLSAVILTAMAWGLTGIFVHWLDGFSLVTVTGGRLLIALVAVIPFLLLSNRAWMSCIKDMRNPWTWGLGVLLMIYYITAVAAFQIAPVADVALLISTSSLFVFLYRVMFRIPSRMMEIFGALVGVAGIALITFADASFARPEWVARLKGDGFALCAAWATATYAVGYRVAAHHNVAPLASNVALITFAVGGLGLSLWAATGPAIPHALSKETVLAFLALGLISTAVPSILFGVASMRLPVLITTTVRLSTPVFATVFSIILLNETPSAWTLPGGILVLCGVFMVLSSQAKETPQQKS